MATTGKLVLPGNISIVALPANCPELNPVDDIWQFKRDNWLSNRGFTSYDNTVDHCCEALKKHQIILQNQDISKL